MTLKKKKNLDNVDLYGQIICFCHVGIRSAAAAVQNLIHSNWDCEADTDRQAILGQWRETHTAWVLFISVPGMWVNEANHITYDKRERTWLFVFLYCWLLSTLCFYLRKHVLLPFSFPNKYVILLHCICTLIPFEFPEMCVNLFLYLFLFSQPTGGPEE